MKPKKSVFANTSTGYGKQKQGNNRSNAKSEHAAGKADGKSAQKTNLDDGVAKTEQQDNDLNSGFGDYLRTPEAFEMMKLFVFANTIMLIVTMAWPNIKEQFFMLNQWWESFQYEPTNMVGPFMQGILLMGIIYWYSKGLLSMINDYYRNEFQRKIDKAESSMAKKAPLTVDNFMQYVEQTVTAEAPPGLINEQQQQQAPAVTPFDMPHGNCWSYDPLHEFLRVTHTVPEWCHLPLSNVIK